MSKDWREIDDSIFPGEVQIEYDYESYSAATLETPEEGGISITNVWWINRVRNNETGDYEERRIDIIDMIPERTLAKWCEEIWHDGNKYSRDREDIEVS